MKWKRVNASLWTCGELAIELSAGEFYELYQGKKLFGVFMCLEAAKTRAEGLQP